MDAVLNAASKTHHEQDDFEADVAALLNDDPFEEYHQAFANEDDNSGDGSTMTARPGEASSRLQVLLRQQLPAYQDHATSAFNLGQRPSRLVRYWLPATLLLISSSTLLRYVANRKAEIMTWIREFGSTVIDFWTNWVLEPMKKVIGTIRHDENSEVSRFA
jgi:nuclear-control-of-ATPase protein 2